MLVCCFSFFVARLTAAPQSLDNQPGAPGTLKIKSKDMELFSCRGFLYLLAYIPSKDRYPNPHTQTRIRPTVRATMQGFHCIKHLMLRQQLRNICKSYGSTHGRPRTESLNIRDYHIAPWLYHHSSLSTSTGVKSLWPRNEMPDGGPSVASLKESSHSGAHAAQQAMTVLLSRGAPFLGLGVWIQGVENSGARKEREF
ncbi:hypothetical protein BDW02DRAFT_580450 [Decorospora gaudefroyi]|uniref:Secreted protein n=1 Tax=Decorospora gaudefroyi TaxID=184978 RepID=A0A6A5KDH2_9PLEO|nr:hypothetical protein BDW02DRAFT_580450 [Decorospora gaudefroyi]